MKSEQPLRLNTYREPWVRTLHLVVALGFLVQASRMALNAIGITLDQAAASDLSISSAGAYNPMLWALIFLGLGLMFLLQYRMELYQGPLNRYRMAIQNAGQPELEQALKQERELSELERMEIRAVLTRRRLDGVKAPIAPDPNKYP